MLLFKENYIKHNYIKNIHIITCESFYNLDIILHVEDPSFFII